MLTRIIRQGRNQKGFTLIELLVVVAIIALLTAFAVPKIFDAISNARNARGQSDMDTVSGALDRYYFENDAYPHGADAAAIRTQLWNGFLKQTTTFINGHKQGYIYITDAAGAFYILVDPGRTSGANSITVTCNAHQQQLTPGAAFQQVVPSGATPIVAADISSGCTITPAGTPFTTN